MYNKCEDHNYQCVTFRYIIVRRSNSSMTLLHLGLLLASLEYNKFNEASLGYFVLFLTLTVSQVLNPSIHTHLPKHMRFDMEHMQTL